MKFLLAVLLLLISFIFSLSCGTSDLGIVNVLRILAGAETRQDWSFILYEFRFPKALAALGTGAALSVSGLMMQTFFRNPLAGPYVLGISGVANLLVGCVILAGSGLGFNLVPLMADFGLPVFACLGAVAAMVIILFLSFLIRSTSSLLLIGIMLGFIYGALQNILEFFAGSTDMKRFVLWNMGSVGNVFGADLIILLSVTCAGIFASLFLAKSLDIFLFGDEYAMSVGLNLPLIRFFIIITTGILSGITVAYCGPIAFVGLAVPHLCRMFWKTAHHLVLIPATAIIGSALLLFCDAFGNLFSDRFVLPINVTTSLFGAPFLIYLLFRNKKLNA